MHLRTTLERKSSETEDVVAVKRKKRPSGELSRGTKRVVVKRLPCRNFELRYLRAWNVGCQLRLHLFSPRSLFHLVLRKKIQREKAASKESRNARTRRAAGTAIHLSAKNRPAWGHEVLTGTPMTRNRRYRVKNYIRSALWIVPLGGHARRRRASHLSPKPEPSKHYGIRKP